MNCLIAESLIPCPIHPPSPLLWKSSTSNPKLKNIEECRQFQNIFFFFSWITILFSIMIRQPIKKPLFLFKTGSVLKHYNRQTYDNSYKQCDKKIKSYLKTEINSSISFTLFLTQLVHCYTLNKQNSFILLNKKQVVFLNILKL